MRLRWELFGAGARAHKKKNRYELIIKDDRLINIVSLSSIARLLLLCKFDRFCHPGAYPYPLQIPRGSLRSQLKSADHRHVSSTRQFSPQAYLTWVDPSTAIYSTADSASAVLLRESRAAGGAWFHWLRTSASVSYDMHGSSFRRCYFSY